MPDSHLADNDFIHKITDIIEKNMSNEQFGVSELASEVGMSRSNLLRKVKKSTDLSASQFIRQVRLQHAMEMLKETSLTVSEVSYKVGFNSTSYFIKCFGDQYGYSPGEIGKREPDEITSSPAVTSKRKILIIGGVSIILLLAVLGVIYLKPSPPTKEVLEKSIAVLPFKDDSNDSSNVHIINGLMESILNNLQNIEGLRVISRTSVEKYRNNPKTIAELAEELDVNYFVEGSGQKIGDQILLNVQLIEASNDKHLWAEQYTRETKDIFKLQNEVAKNIADKVEVVITPAEEKRIDKIPTNDITAYDYFLKGQDLLYQGSDESLMEAIRWFKKAIERDNEFAHAYADIAIAYYFLDADQTEKKFSHEINANSDNALLYDPQLPQSLIAKALFYIYNHEYELAVPYFEKALEYNPNSALVINILSDFYTRYIPNTEKYLEYALKGIRLDIAAHDSTTASFIYLHVSNAFIQTGFVDEALRYIDRSLDYNPDNLYSQYVKAFILYARDRDLLQTKELLIEVLNKDSTRLDILQEVGKICYFMRDYESAYRYYKKYVDIKTILNLDIYRGEDAKIGLVYSKMGLSEESEKLFNAYKEYAENDKSIYKHLSLGAYYSYMGDTNTSLEHLDLFTQQDNYHYWIIIFLGIDPLMDNVKDTPEYQKILNTLEVKFWNNHEQIKASLKVKNLI